MNAKSQAGIGRVNVLELFLLGRQVFRKLTFYLIKEEKVFQSLFKFSVTRDIPPSPSFLPFGAEKFPEKLKKVTASDSCKSNYLFFKKSVRKIMLQNWYFIAVASFPLSPLLNTWVEFLWSCPSRARRGKEVVVDFDVSLSFLSFHSTLSSPSLSRSFCRSLCPFHSISFSLSLYLSLSQGQLSSNFCQSGWNFKLALGSNKIK